MDDCLQKFPAKEHDRDTRVDFFRGVALILIFIDHIPGNVFARLTLTNFGFADAAEVFVLLAGIGAFLAYAKAFAEGSGRGLQRLSCVSAISTLLTCWCSSPAWPDSPLSHVRFKTRSTSNMSI